MLEKLEYVARVTYYIAELSDNIDCFRNSEMFLLLIILSSAQT
jgi:hypothetical protein